MGFSYKKKSENMLKCRGTLPLNLNFQSEAIL